MTLSYSCNTVLAFYTNGVLKEYFFRQNNVSGYDSVTFFYNNTAAMLIIP